MTQHEKPQPNSPHRTGEAPKPGGPWGIFAWAGPLVALGALVGPILAAWGSLPDRVAMSWRSGEVINLREAQTLLAMFTMFAVICAALFVLGGMRILRGDSFNAGAILLAGVLTAVFAVQSLMTVLANVGQFSGAAVQEPSVWWTLAAVVAPFVVVVSVGAMFRDALVASPPIVDAAPSAGLDLAAAETAAWHSGATARWSGFLAVAAWAVPLALVAAGALVGVVFLVAFLVVLPLIVVMSAFARIGVSIDHRGLTIRYGRLPWPKTNIPLHDIVSADAAQVRPGDQGGWGYRGSRALLGRAAVVVRAGEGISLRLVGGKAFTVTVDHAARGAGVLNDLLGVHARTAVPG